MKKLILLFCLMLLPATMLFAHGGGHFKGTIVTANASSVTLKTVEGKTVKFETTASTLFFEGEQKTSIAAVHSGSRAVIHLRTDGKVAEIHLPSHPAK